MGAFCFSELLPLRRFGLFAGLGALASVGALLSILPVWLHRFPLDDREIRSLAGPRQDGSPSPRLAGLFETAITGRGMMAVAGLLVFGAAIVGVQQLRTGDSPPRDARRTFVPGERLRLVRRAHRARRADGNRADSSRTNGPAPPTKVPKPTVSNIA